jgi:hypothetical protein
MGMEDFGVILRPNQAVSALSIECQLVSNGFVVNNFVSMSFPNQATYVLSDSAKNIEALLKRNAADETLADYLSIRYAICQPDTATQAFLDVVSQLVCKYPLQIEGTSSGKEFSRGNLNEFRDFVAEKIVGSKSRWSSLFEGDCEEVVLSVADTWKYFRTKHPGVFTK